MNAREQTARRRRAVAVGGLALVLGGVAASDMRGRERALAERVGEPVPVLIAARQIPAGARVAGDALAIRRVPARFAPEQALSAPEQAAGTRAAVTIPQGSEVLGALLDDGRTPGVGAPVARGERVIDVTAGGSPELVQPGSRVDVLVTREGRDGGGATVLALQDVEVLAAAGAEAAQRAAGPQVLASLRVSIREAMYLAAAQAFGREIRLLPRAVGDRRRLAGAPAVPSDLPAP